MATHGFSEDSARRIANAVRTVEGLQSRGAAKPRDIIPAGFAALQFVRLTSAVQTASRYPGKWVTFDEAATGTTGDDRDAIWVVCARGTTLATGVNYLARFAGYANSRPVYRVSEPAGGSGITSLNGLTGATQTFTNDTNVTIVSGGTAHVITWSGTLAVTRGGTGLATATQGDLLYGSAANTYSALAKDTNATRYLSNTGASNNPAWAQVNVANGVTGTLPIGNGGTGGATAAAAKTALGLDYVPAANPVSTVSLWKTATLQLPCDASSAGTGLTGVNINSALGSGTLSVQTNARGHFMGCQSAALTGNDAGINAGQNCVHLDQTPVVTMIVEFPNSTDFGSGNNARAWCGVSSDNATLITQDTLNNISGLAFRISSGTTDTNWQCCRNDGGATAPAVTDSGVTVAAATKYVLQIDATDNTSVKFYINGTLVATMTTAGGDLPATSTRMAPVMNVRTLTNAAKNIYLGLYRQDFQN